MIEGFNIKDYPNASAFVVTLKKADGTIQNVATFNYDFGVEKELVRIEAEVFCAYTNRLFNQVLNLKKS